MRKTTNSLVFALLILVMLCLCSCGVRGTTQASTPPTDAPETVLPTVIKAVLEPIRTPQPPTPVVAVPTRDPLLNPVTPVPAAGRPTAALPHTATPSQRERTPALRYQNPLLAAQLDQIIDQVAAEPPHAGIVMYVYAPGQGTWIASRGLANREAKQPVTSDARFRIASLTKTYVATLVLQLAEEGVLSLDDTVEQWLPGTVPNGDQISLRQLLNHTSGLYDYLDYQFEQQYFGEETLRVWSPAEMVAYGVTKEPYFAPGTPGKWKYSNTNYLLLGMVVEQATDSTLTEQLHRRIFTPLGMENSFLEDYEEIPDGFVHGYIGKDDYTYASLCAWAAGGIVSNVEDVATFLQALFNGTLLGEEMQKQMLTFARVDFPHAAMTNYPLYGLGVTRNVEALGLATMGAAPMETRFDEVWGHIGGLSGFKSTMAYLPESGTTVIVLINEMYKPVVPVALDALSVVEGTAESVVEP